MVFGIAAGALAPERFMSPVAFAVGAGNSDVAEEIDRIELQRLQAAGRVTIVDARHEESYLAGHIPGAINLPVDSETEDMRRIMRNVPTEVPIVVYCQSRNCPYVDLLTAGLRSDGYKHLLIYRGGWFDWSADQSHTVH
jgi:rhodanese-related sulfurtransferase